MGCKVCSCSRFLREIMETLHVNDLEKKNPDASDIDLVFGEVERLQRSDEMLKKILQQWEDMPKDLFTEINEMIED